MDEFIAELSSKEFRKFLKAQDLFKAFVDGLMRFYFDVFEKFIIPDTLKELKTAYYKILDEYEPPIAPLKRSEVDNKAVEARPSATALKDGKESGIESEVKAEKPLNSTLERDLSDTAQVSKKEALSENEVKNQQVR